MDLDKQQVSCSYNTSSPVLNGLPSDPLFSIKKLSEIAGECIFQVRFSKIFLGEIPHTPSHTLAASRLKSALFIMCTLPFLNPGWSTDHASSFIFDRIIIKVAGNQDRHIGLDEFDFGPDQTTHFGVTCP